MNWPLFEKFCVFAKAQVVSGDLDPTYPVLHRLYANSNLPAEIRLWRTLLYVTWYNLHSAETVWKAYPEPGRLPDDLRLPTGTERRAFRGNALAAFHVNSVLEMVNALYKGKLENWMAAAIQPYGKMGWQSVRASFKALPYGGSWSSYKWADMMKSVHGYPITANDIGVGGGGETAGPVPGMVQLTGEPWQKVAHDVELQQFVHDAAVDHGVPFNGLDQLETSCCDFNSLTKGSYYVGHDIDTQQAHVAHCSMELQKARLASFPQQYLGEHGGWFGVRKELKTHYVRTGQVLT